MCEHRADVAAVWCVQTVEFATSEYKRRGINIHQFTSPSKIEKNEDGR